MIELTNGEILLRPFSQGDKKQWRRVRTLNREWLEEWEATVPKISKLDELKGPISFNKMVRTYRREARAGRSFSFGIFKGPNLIGQINLGGVIYGALRGAHIGYWIDRNYANRGIMSEAVNMVTDFAFNELELHRIEINIRPENSPSIRVAEKCGYLYEGLRPRYLHIDGKWRDHHCFVRENSAIK
jgi:[ribosomal protein S5]-alanine N-acetyltransferase